MDHLDKMNDTDIADIDLMSLVHRSYNTVTIASADRMDNFSPYPLVPTGYQMIPNFEKKKSSYFYF